MSDSAEDNPRPTRNDVEGLAEHYLPAAEVGARAVWWIAENNFTAVHDRWAPPAQDGSLQVDAVFDLGPGGDYLDLFTPTANHVFRELPSWFPEEVDVGPDTEFELGVSESLPGEFYGSPDVPRFLFLRYVPSPVD